MNQSPLHLEPLPKLAHIDPQLPVAVGLTGLDHAGQRMLVIDVEPNWRLAAMAASLKWEIPSGLTSPLLPV